MRVNRLVMLLVCCSMGLAALRVPSAQAQDKEAVPEKEPTLGETLKWLTGKIQDYGGHDITSYEVTRADGNIFAYSETLAGLLTNRVKLELSGLKPPDKPEVWDRQKFGRKSVYHVTLATESGRPLIVTETIFERSGPFPPKASAKVQIAFLDETLANRVTKAFAHAIRLCREKKEPF